MFFLVFWKVKETLVTHGEVGRRFKCTTFKTRPTWKWRKSQTIARNKAQLHRCWTLLGAGRCNDWPVYVQGAGLVKGQLCVKESVTHHVNHRNRRLAFESCSVGNVATAALIKRSARVLSVWRFLCSCFHSICRELNFKKRWNRDFSLCQWITSLLLKATTQRHKLLPVGNSKLMSANPQSLTSNQSWTSSQNKLGDCAGTFRFIMMFKHEAYRKIFPFWHRISGF